MANPTLAGFLGGGRNLSTGAGLEAGWAPSVKLTHDCCCLPGSCCMCCRGIVLGAGDGAGSGDILPPENEFRLTDELHLA